MERGGGEEWETMGKERLITKSGPTFLFWQLAIIDSCLVPLAEGGSAIHHI
jgi:hypothetical protein